MGAALNIKEFEQTFRSEIIRKGFTLFKNNRISLADKKGKGVSVFHFEKTDIILEVKRSGEKILSSSCSCGKTKCEHLCAAVFYFQKELFDDLSFTSKRGSLPEGHRFFRENCKVVKNLLNSTERNELLKEAQIYVKNHKTVTVYFYLAVIHETISAFSSKFTETDAGLNALLLYAKDKLREHVKKGLKPLEKSAWILAAKNSVSNYKRFNSKQFSFLIPYAAVFIKDKNDIEELREQFSKRRLSVRFPSEPDLKFFALCCLDLAFDGLQNKKKPVEKNKLPEEYMAAAEMEFCKGHSEKAFGILRSGFESLAKKKPASFIGYIEFVLEKAKEYRHRETEVEFLEHLFVYDSYISPLQLHRLQELMNEKQRKTFIDQLVRYLEANEKNNFNKIADLLFSEKRYDELITKISRRKNMFRLLNTVMIQKLPDVDESAFTAYAEHFKQAVASALETHYQEHIFNLARNFIDKLPRQTKSKLLESLLAGTAKHSYLYSYILKIYPY